MNTAELQLLLSMKDTASAVVRTAVGAIGGALVGALSDAAKAAAEDEANTLHLSQAIDNSGASYADLQGQIDATIAKGQSLAFTDSQTRDSIAQLTASTGDATKAISLQSLVADVARGKQVDYGTATDIVQKAALGQFGALKKLGIVLPENATATEALAAIQGKFAGQAEAYGSTTEASIFKVKDAVGEWVEGIGASLGPAQGFLALLPGMSAGFSLAGGAVGGLSTLIKGPMIASMLASVPATIAMMAPFAPLLIAIAAIAAGILLLKIAFDNNFLGIRDVVLNVFGWIQGAIKVFQEEGLGGLLRYIGEFVVSIPEKFAAMGRGIVEGIMSGLAGLGSAVFSAIRDAFSHIDFWLGPFHVTSSGVSISIPSISLPSLPSFQYGGVVPGPIGEPTPVIAHGGERFLGVNGGGGGGRGGGGGHTFVFNAPVYGIEDFRREVVEAVSETERSGGFRGVFGK